MHPDLWPSSLDHKKVMWGIVELVLKHSKEHPLIDSTLEYCGSRPIFFEPGMTLVMLAGKAAQEKFRKHLVHAGAFRQAMHLAQMMDCPLTQSEIVLLGNAQQGGLNNEETKKFLEYAAEIDGIKSPTGASSLTLGRLRRQFSDPLLRR